MRSSDRTSGQESGQATIEYVLILFIVVVIGVLVLRDFVRPLLETMSGYISQFVEETLFNRADFHRFRK